MYWNERKRVFGLADPRCYSCRGTGIGDGGWDDRGNPCACVFRAIFRICLREYQRIEWGGGHFHVRWRARVYGVAARFTPSRPFQEFAADFCLVARRHLTPAQWALFRRHYVEDLPWFGCLGYLARNRGEFFHEIYRMQKHLGRVFASLRPYALYPLQGYYAEGTGVMPREPGPAIDERPPGRMRLEPPVEIPRPRALAAAA